MFNLRSVLNIAGIKYTYYCVCGAILVLNIIGCSIDVLFVSLALVALDLGVTMETV